MGVLACRPGAELGFVPRGPPEALSWPGWSVTLLARVQSLKSLLFHKQSTVRVPPSLYGAKQALTL